MQEHLTKARGGSFLHQAKNPSKPWQATNKLDGQKSTLVKHLNRVNSDLNTALSTNISSKPNQSKNIYYGNFNNF